MGNARDASRFANRALSPCRRLAHRLDRRVARCRPVPCVRRGGGPRRADLVLAGPGDCVDSDRTVALFSVAIAPSYVLFALCVMIVSPMTMRLLRWKTPADVQMRIADMDWWLLRWVRYVASIHLARVIAGTLVRGTPLWTWHLRLNGAPARKASVRQQSLG